VFLDRVFSLPVKTHEMYGAFRSRLLSGGDGANPEVHIWDVETGNSLRVFNGHKQPVAALAWTEDQRLVPPALLTGRYASGKSRQGTACVSWQVIDPTFVWWHSARRARGFCLDRATVFSSSGT